MARTCFKWRLQRSYFYILKFLCLLSASRDLKTFWYWFAYVNSIICTIFGQSAEVVLLLLMGMLLLIKNKCKENHNNKIDYGLGPWHLIFIRVAAQAHSHSLHLLLLLQCSEDLNLCNITLKTCEHFLVCLTFWPPLGNPKKRSRRKLPFSEQWI